jgi:hypothetical protein
MPKTAAWTRKEGKNPKGGLNAKGVASYRAAKPWLETKDGSHNKTIKTKTRVQSSKTSQIVLR